MIELSNSKTTCLGGNRFALKSGMRAILMRDPSGDWEDIKPRLVEDATGWHAEGVPYAFELLRDGTRYIYPDKTDRSKYLHILASPLFRGLPKTQEGNSIIASTGAFDVIFQITNTGVKFKIILKKPLPSDRIEFEIEAVGIDLSQLLASKRGIGIPTPHLMEIRHPIDELDLRPERSMEWSIRPGRIELGFDPMGLRYPLLLKNTTVDVQVDAGENDGGSDSDGGFDATSEGYYIGAGSKNYDTFGLLTGITIPGGATIISATYSHWSGAGSGGTAVLQLHADDTVTPTVPTDRATHVAKTRTTNYASPATPFPYILEPEEVQTNVLSVVNELYGDYDYSGGASMQFFTDNAGVATNYTRQAMWEYDVNQYGVELEIVYAEGIGGGSLAQATLLLLG